MSEQAQDELFIRVGTKGVAEAKQKISGLRGAFSEFAKALSSFRGNAFVAGVAGLTKMSGDFGVNMLALQTRTGMAAEAFQKFAYAGELAGIKSEETMNTLSSIQKQMDKFALTGEGPEWINEVAASVKNFDYDRIHDTVYMFQKLQQYATDPRINKMRKRVTLESFGLSDKMIAALMRGSFNQRAMGQANPLSGKEIKDLAVMGSEWNKFAANFKNATYKFAAVVLSRPMTDFIQGLNHFTDQFKAITDITGSAIDDVSEFIEGAFFDPTGDIQRKRIAKQYADRANSGDKLRQTDIAAMASEAQILRIKRRQQMLQKDPEYQKKRAELEAQGRSFGPKSNIPLLFSQPAAPVKNQNRTLNNSTADNRKVTVNQTNNFTNASDNPQKIRQATQDGIKGVMGMQQQLNQAAMATSFASTGS